MDRVDEEADEIIVEEIIIGSIIVAIIDKIAGGGAIRDKTAGEVETGRDKITGDEAIHNNTAGAIVAVRDKVAGEGEAILKAAEQVVELLVEPSDEAILEATEESKDPGSNPNRSKTIDCL